MAIDGSQLEDFREQVSKRRRVLRKLGHISAEGMLTVKGQAAAEVRTLPTAWCNLCGVLVNELGLHA